MSITSGWSLASDRLRGAGRSVSRRDIDAAREGRQARTTQKPAARGHGLDGFSSFGFPK
jgi:hypothetical protein